jgi:hypothetical protein
MIKHNSYQFENRGCALLDIMITQAHGIHGKEENG